MKVIYKSRRHVTQVVTPEMAKKFLSNQAPNRPLHLSQVKYLESEIRKGNFFPNGSPIIIDQYGRLMDGQHRCTAIVNAEKSVVSDVIYGQIYEETCHSLGHHEARTNRDKSSMFYPDLPKDTFAIAKSILAFETKGDCTRNNPLIDDFEIDDFVKGNIDFFRYLGKNRIGHKPIYLRNFETFKVMEYILGKIEKEKTQKFFDNLFFNTVERDSPEWTLIRWLESARMTKAAEGSTANWVYGGSGNRNFFNAVAIAWKACQDGKTMQRMKFFKPNGDSNIPDIYGMYCRATKNEGKAIQKKG